MTSTASLNGDHGAPDAGRIVSMHTLTAALRRRWRLWMSGAVAGAAAALALSALSPPQHTATTILLLAHPGQTDGSRAMVTDARLVKSRAVAQRAIDDLRLRMAPQQLVEEYEPGVLSDDLLQIKVSAPSDREAVRRAEAVASSFLTFRRDEVQRQSKVAIQNLEERQRELNLELLEVNEAINARTGAQGKDALDALADLLVRRNTLNDMLGGVRQRIQNSTFDTDDITEKSRVLDPAREDPRSPRKAAVVNTAAGLILGLLLTTGLIVVQEATTDRLRRREDVAAALGVSIGSSLGAIRGPMWFQRRRFRRFLATPTPDVVRLGGHLLGALGRVGPGRRALVLVSVDSDATAALALASTTLRLLEEGRSVLVVDLTRSNILARLTKVRPDVADRLPLVGTTSALWLSTPPGQMPELQVTEASDIYRELAAQVDVVLALATVDPVIGANHLIELAPTAVVAATAGRATAVGLRSVAQLIAAAGLQLHSAVLVGADHADESAGLLESGPLGPVGCAPKVGFNR